MNFSRDVFGASDPIFLIHQKFLISSFYKINFDTGCGKNDADNPRILGSY
jgi:hypothetical protein